MQYIIDHFNEIATGVFMACFVSWLGWRTWNKTRRIKAADKFHSIITTTLKDLYSVSGDIKWPNNPDFNINSILTNLYPVIANAVTDYAYVVKNKQAFLNDWDIYRGKDHAGMKSDQNYTQYSGATFNGLPLKSAETIFHNNVSNLLKHAKT